MTHRYSYFYPSDLVSFAFVEVVFFGVCPFHLILLRGFVSIKHNHPNFYLYNKDLLRFCILYNLE